MLGDISEESSSSLDKEISDDLNVEMELRY